MSGPRHALPGLVLTDHRLEVPLDHGRPNGETISVFAREVVRVERREEELPWMVFLQGGPGFPAPRVMGRTGWVGRAVKSHRLLLLDQRGTGNSSPIEAAELVARFPEPADQAEHLRHYRADSIVRDAELFRHAVAGGAKWTVLGQSFGGFCAVHYLSAAPGGLAGALITGGLPSLTATAEDVYRRTYPLVEARNCEYFGRYPGDAERLTALCGLLEGQDVRLPGGDRLTPRRFLQLGLQLGMSDGAETIHYVLEAAFARGPRPVITYGFLRAFENAQSFDTNPIFSILHEACYAQGGPTDWAAARVLAERPAFASTSPPLFTGEMVYPWQFEDIAQLAPLRAAADLLAAKDDWPALYDTEALARNRVPVAAAIYANDMYVERGYSEQTAAAIPGTRVWLTNEFEHNGLRADGHRILDRLLDLLHGRA